MQRVIEFRGKCVSDGQWVYGWFDHSTPLTPVIWSLMPNNGCHPFEVDPATVGQFLGMAGSARLFDGDIITKTIHKEKDYSGTGTYSVSFAYPSIMLTPICFSDSLSGLFGENKIFGNAPTPLWLTDTNKMVIIGNIHDQSATP